jgi:cytochrome c-type protein NapB
MNKRSFLLAVVILTGAFVARAVVSAPKTTPDRELGLSKSSVFDVPNPGAVALNTSEPGEELLTEPAFPGSPSVIPHGIADFVPISWDDNQCIDCHQVDEKEEGEPTPIPESHFRDLRNAPDEVREDIAGSRFVCTTCHASLTVTEPLVGNGF